MNKPFLSVIIPLYNNERFIAHCVSSVLNQPFRDIEVIIIDDGSTDNGLTVARELSAAHENVFTHHQSNAGVSAARNAGIRQARGEYLIFADSDDLWQEGCVTDAFLSSVTRSAPDVVSCGLFREIGSECVKLGVEQEVGTLQIGPHFLRYPFSNHHVCSLLYRRGFLLQYDLHFKEGIRFAEDKVFVDMCFYCAGQVCFVDHPFYRYVDNPGSVMNSKNTDAFGSLIHAFNVRMWESTALTARRSYGSETDRKTERAVQSLAVGSILEMLELHFSNSFSVKKAYRELDRHHLREYLDNCSAYSLPPHVSEQFRLFARHPYRFAAKHRLRGIARSVALRLLPASVKNRIRIRNTAP